MCVGLCVCASMSVCIDVNKKKMYMHVCALIVFGMLNVSDVNCYRILCGSHD